MQYSWPLTLLLVNLLAGTPSEVASLFWENTDNIQCVCVHMCMYICVCVCSCMYICVYVCMPLYMSVCVNMYANEHKYGHIYMTLITTVLAPNLLEPFFVFLSPVVPPTSPRPPLSEEAD